MSLRILTTVIRTNFIDYKTKVITQLAASLFGLVLKIPQTATQMVKSLQERTEKLLSRTEAMVLLCSKASTYWSFVKYGFNIPLVLTSSAMLILNSISEDANVVKIPNIIVNAISVLIMSLNNSIKASEKNDLFRRLGQNFLLLSGEIENDNEVTDHDFSIMVMKYDNLVNECLFEEIPARYKEQVAECFSDRHVPLQLTTSVRMARPTRSSVKSDVVVSPNNAAVASGSEIV